MRFLHTADWHLGRTLHGHVLVDDQAYLLDEVARLVADLKCDALLIAGDIFDRAVPAPEAVAILDEFLAKMIVDRRLPVIVIAGNHDSPRRLGFGAKILAPQGLTIRADLVSVGEPVRLADASGPVDIFPIPYVEPPTVNLARGTSIHSHHDAMKVVIGSLSIDARHRTLAMAHLFLKGGAESESERPLTVGTLEGVAPELFDPFTYVALGHLHRPQVWCEGRIRYSGSLMRLSFDEADHQKSCVLVDVASDGTVTSEAVPLTPKRDVICRQGFLNDLLAGEPAEDFVSVQLHDEGAILDAHGRLREIFPNLCEVIRPHYRPMADHEDRRHARAERGTGELFGDFYELMTGDPMPPAERDAFSRLYRDFSADEREAGP